MTKGFYFTALECPAGTFESEQLEGKKVCSVQGTSSDATLTRGNFTN